MAGGHRLVEIIRRRGALLARSHAGRSSRKDEERPELGEGQTAIGQSRSVSVFSGAWGTTLESSEVDGLVPYFVIGYSPTERVLLSYTGRLVVVRDAYLVLARLVVSVFEVSLS